MAPVAVGRLVRIGRCICSPAQKRGERTVSSLPSISAPVIVIGKNTSELPMGLWSKKLLRCGPEVVEINRPAAHRNGQTDLIFLVALAVQRQEAQSAVLGKGQQRSGERLKGWRLIELPPKAAQHPPDYGEPDRSSRVADRSHSRW